MRAHLLGFLTLFVTAAAPAWARTPAPQRPYPRGERLHLDLPLLDVHENAVLGYWPSMRQSMATTKDAYYLVHGAIMAIPYPEFFSNGVVNFFDYALIGAADFFSLAIPPFMGWHHEEWHRSVMSQYGISSYDDIYDFPIFKDLINVSHVADDDLVRLKRDHPADQVRMSSAGIEADFSRQIDFDKDRFFYGTRGATLFLEWLGTLNGIMYMGLAARSDSNKETADLEVEEGEDVEIRDFTGLDPDGWVYDLFRPNEPYEDRGIHPSGIGIDRYRTVSDLTPRERRYLRNTARLSLLNLVNPSLFGFYEFEAGEIDGDPFSFNASMHSVMAPFGYTVGLNLFAKAGRYKIFGALHAFMSDTLVLPGLSAELLRYPLPWFNANLTPRVRLWLQPKDQLFAASSARPGGSLEARLSVPLWSSFEFYVEGAAKSVGWVPGNEFLHQSLNLRTGLEAFVF